MVDNRVMTFFAPTSFGVTRFKPGYDMREVDAFVAGIAQRTVQEIQEVMFKTTRLSPGYEQAEVDAHLDACIAGKRMDPPAR